MNYTLFTVAVISTIANVVFIPLYILLRKEYLEAIREISRLHAGFDASEAENLGYQSTIADYDRELANVSLERDALQRQIDGLTSMTVIDFTRGGTGYANHNYRENGKPDIKYVR